MTTCAVCELHAESTFKIEGMDCREEVAMIERRFKNLPGLEDFSADLVGQRLHVKYDATKVSASAIVAAVADAGLRAWLEHEEPIAAGGQAAKGRRVLLAISGAALGLGLLVDFVGAAAPLGLVLFGLSIALGVPPTLRRAWHAVRLRSLDINVLMLIAVAGAMLLGEWSEAASVVFLFGVARALEARTLEKARTAVRAVMDLAPADALVRDETGERRIAVDLVIPGAIIVVKPGEKLPLDGEVLAGASSVNQAPVTGESLPVDKGPGDEVFAGSINGRGALEVRVTRPRRDSTLARIIHLVEQAQAQRAPSQTFVERFARVYTPAVIALAVTVAVVPPLFGDGTWETWIYRALVLLVVSCPCALVISTPVSIVAALAGAARKGVLIKGGAHLERAGRVRCVAFDKTGTLTCGTPAVVDVDDRRRPAGQGASLVKSHAPHTPRTLEMRAPLDEHPFARRARECRDNRNRRGDHERAGTRDDQQDQGAVDPGFPRAITEQRRHDGDGHRQRDDGRCVYAREALDECLGRGALRLRLFHQMNDAGQR